MPREADIINKAPCCVLCVPAPQHFAAMEQHTINQPVALIAYMVQLHGRVAFGELL